MDSSNAGELMTYFSLAQFPRSSRRHRSPQNGKSAFVSESVGFRQIGQLAFMQRAYRKGLNSAASHAGSQPARGSDREGLRSTLHAMPSECIFPVPGDIASRNPA